MITIDDSIRIRLNSIMNAKLHAMTLFCQSEINKGSHHCEYTLQCCKYNPNSSICPCPECGKILSNILLCDIGDIINFAGTPRSGAPVDMLKEALKHRESAVVDKEDTRLQTDEKTQSNKV